MSHNDGLKNRILIILVMVLLQHRHPFIGSHMHFTLVWLDLSGKNFEEGRFTRPVRTDETIAVTRRKLYIHIFKKCSLSVTERYTSSTYHFGITILY
ncbi:hypothetical protein D3C77_469680 [compost metagenome]